MESLKTAANQKTGKTFQNINVKTTSSQDLLYVDLKSVYRFSEEYIRDGVTIGISRNLDEIALLRPLWDKMQQHETSNIPDINYNKFTTFIKSMNGNSEPFIMYLKKDDTPLSLVIGRIEDQSLDIRLGYHNLFSPKLKFLHIIYGGIVGNPDENLCHILIDELKAQLRAKCADILQFHFLKTDTAIYRTIKKISGNCPFQPTPDKHWRMAVPNSIEEFYSARSRGHRHNLRKAKYKFEHTPTGEVRYINYTSESDVDEFLYIASQISKKTYQYALNAGLVNDEITRERLKSDAANGWFRGHIVFAGDKPCAFLLGLQYENTYYMVNMGFAPSFKSYNPGLMLFIKTLEGLCYEPAIEYIDFYFGDAEYKNRYGTEYWYEASVCLFAPGFYPMLIRILQTLTTGLNSCLKSIINKLGFTNQIKRYWRNLLSSNQKNSVSAEKM